MFDTGSAVAQEVWTNVPGTNIAIIPLGTPANRSRTRSARSKASRIYGDNYGERIRGYFTAPATGNYYFWIAGSDSAQLWISDDSEPVNKVRGAPCRHRAAPAPHQWNLQANQQSGWLSLVAGQKYYVEILHKAGTGTTTTGPSAGCRIPTGTNTAPTGRRAGLCFVAYYPPLPHPRVPARFTRRTCWRCAGVEQHGVGSATLRVSADGSQAILNYTLYRHCSAPDTADHIYADPYLEEPPGAVVFDIAAAPQQPDGSYLWNIKPTGPLATADILEIINGKQSLSSSQTPRIIRMAKSAGISRWPPARKLSRRRPPPPAWTDDHANTNAAVRFLTQATFGASSDDIAAVQSLGYDGGSTTSLRCPRRIICHSCWRNVSADPMHISEHVTGSTPGGSIP